MSKKKYTFRPRAKLVSTLGEELISSDTVALIELVKNAFDADAEHVLIQFHGPLSERAGGVDVIDDGHGMSLATIENAWLEPATRYKTNRPRSEGGRRRQLGEKGVGRFATQRLGHSLLLATRRFGEEADTRVAIDWDSFDGEAFLSDIQVDVEVVAPSLITRDGVLGTLWHAFESKKRRESGTLLQVQSLRHAWRREHFQDLTRGLSRLVSPFFKETAFRIRVSAPSPFEQFTQEIGTPEILEKPKYVLKGTVSSDGAARLTLTSKLAKTITRTTSQRWWLPDSNSDDPHEVIVDATSTDALRPPKCGPIAFELRIWDREEKDLKPLADSLGVRVRDLREDLDQMAGLNIYRDGFRVLPYGEPGNDWLNLDARRVQKPGVNISNNQVVGYISLGRDANPSLTDQTHRQGLIENTAYRDLRAILMAAIRWVENQRYDLREPERESRKRSKGLYDREEFRALHEYIRREHRSDTKLVALVDKVETRAQAIENQTQEVISRYRRLANLGGLVDKILHDSITPLGLMRNEAQFGQREVRPRLSDLNGFAEGILSRFVKIDEGGAQLSGVFRRLAPFGGRKPGRPQEIAIEAVIKSAAQFYDPEITEFGIQVSLPSSTTMVTVEPGEITQVISNLVDNAIYWLKRVPRESRALSIDVNRPSSSRVQIDVSDSGPGVDQELKHRVFDPYFSTKPNGTGLGLAIAGEILEDYYDGTLELLDRGRLSGATFRATLNRRV